MERPDEIGGVIHEKHSVRDVFLTQIGEKFSPDCYRIRRKEPRVQDSISFGIDSRIQPVFLVVDADRLLIDRNSIRTFATSWL